jgi:hypothetical protein
MHALPHSIMTSFLADYPQNVTLSEILPYRETLSERILVKAKMEAQLHWFRTENHAIFAQRQNARSVAGRTISTIASRLGKLHGNESGTQKLDRWHHRSAAKSEAVAYYVKWLQENKTDVVFCTHQRSRGAIPVMLAARKLGIPTATFIYSWDNLPKGRMAVYADHFFVWSDFMRSEMHRYYPEVAENRIHIVGTPQFEHYFNPELLQTRSEFFKELGIDPNRPILCFSGDDVSTSPHDPDYLADIAEALLKLPEATRPQLLFRRCPVDRSRRYDAVLAEYPWIVVSDPLWQSIKESDWTKIIPTREDIRLLVNVVAHCDCVINIGSTMAADFAIFDKPAIYLNYNQNRPESTWSIKNTYAFPHFRTINDLQPVHWLNEKKEIADVISHVLTHPEEKRNARRAWLEKLTVHPLDQATVRIKAALIEIAKQH